MAPVIPNSEHKGIHVHFLPTPIELTCGSNVGVMEGDFQAWVIKDSVAFISLSLRSLTLGQATTML